MSLNIETLPFHKEAWLEYKKEKIDEYTNLNQLQQDNMVKAKKGYKKYLAVLEELQKINAKLETLKNNLSTAKISQEFYNIDRPHDRVLKSFIKCASEELNKVQEMYVSTREEALSCHSMVMCYIKACEDLKKELQNNFDEFCKEKYNTVIPNLEEKLHLSVGNYNSTNQKKKI